VGTKKIIQECANTPIYSIVMVKTKESGIDDKGIFTKFWPEGVAEKSAFVT
jgi:hypothetical protein